MSLYEQIVSDLKDAMKAGEKDKTQILRFMMAEIKKEAVDAGTDRENIADEVSLKVLEKAVKSRKDSVRIYTEQNRHDLAEPELREIEMIQTYLPAQMGDEELAQIVAKVKAENPSVQGMALMGKIMPLVKGKADPERIRPLL